MHSWGRRTGGEYSCAHKIPSESLGNCWNTSWPSLEIPFEIFIAGDWYFQAPFSSLEMVCKTVSPWNSSPSLGFHLAKVYPAQPQQLKSSTFTVCWDISSGSFQIQLGIFSLLKSSCSSSEVYSSYLQFYAPGCGLTMVGWVPLAHGFLQMDWKQLITP